MGGKVGENPAALRTAVFSLYSINLGGGGVKRPLARGVRGAGEISAKFKNELRLLCPCDKSKVFAKKTVETLYM